MSYDTANDSLAFTAFRRLYTIKGIRRNDKMSLLFHVSVTRLEHMSFLPPLNVVRPFGV